MFFLHECPFSDFDLKVIEMALYFPVVFQTKPCKSQVAAAINSISVSRLITQLLEKIHDKTQRQHKADPASLSLSSKSKKRYKKGTYLLERIRLRGFSEFRLDILMALHFFIIHVNHK